MSRDIFLESTVENLVSRTPNRPKAATRNIDLMAQELAVYGYVTTEVQAMSLDEELTHAAEVMAVQEKGYAVVPRVYQQKGEDLIDPYGQSLRCVLDDGIEWSQGEVEEGVAGANWELDRRRAERSNLEAIINMPANTACLEISANPYDKPKEEQLAQHYTGLTMIRLSIKGETDEVLQYNYAVPVSNPEFLSSLQTRLGVEADKQTISSDQLLKWPIIFEIEQPPESTARETDGLIGAALLETAIGPSTLRMLKRAIEGKRETWQFATSEVHTDIHRELIEKMIQAAPLSPADRYQAMMAIRSGFWKEFKDRFQGNQRDQTEGSILMAAASRAVADGDVFIACGSTVTATEFSVQQSATSRAQIANSLRNEVNGSGSCSACGAKGVLYGCGIFCGKCNDKWCDVYEKTGKQLDPKELAYLTYSRGTNSGKESAAKQSPTGETFGQCWARLGREIRHQREIKKIREAEAKQLKKESELALAA